MRLIRQNILLAVFCGWLAAAFLCPNGLAQATFTAQLRGTVQDASGAVIPGTAVLVTNQATGDSLKTTSDDAGRYVFNELRPAVYRVEAEAPGFKRLVRPGVELRVGLQIDLDLKMEVGDVTTTVEVAEASPLLNSVSAALGQEVTNRYITEVPLFQRAVLNLAFLAPGVTEMQGGSFGWSYTNFVSNGQRNSTAEVRLDGGPLSAPEGGEGGTTNVKYTPTMEVVQEFKLQNNSFSAEFGNNGGTVINIVTKSGTNEFHGAGYWFGRRPELDANDFFANRGGAVKPDYSQNAYGGMLGGPIRRNQFFFLSNVEFRRFSAPQSTTASVPTELQRRGDFSQTRNANGSLQTIFNPLDTYRDAAGVIKRRPFSGNVIPASRFDPAGSKVLNAYPAPTGPGHPVTGLRNFTASKVRKIPEYQFDIKLDYTLTATSRLGGRYSRNHLDDERAVFFLDQGTDAQNMHNGVLELSWLISPTAVWANRVGVDRFHQDRRSTRVDLSSFGLPAQVLNMPFGIPRMPRFDVQGFQRLGNGCCMDTVEAHTLWAYSSTLSKVLGAHNLRFGGERQWFLNNFFQPPNPNGRFVFNRRETMEQVFRSNSAQGNAAASLLLGFGRSGNLGWVPSTANKSAETSLFVQDDWRVTQRLTLNLGLRYEWSTPFTDRWDRLQISDFTGDSGIEVPGLGRLPGISRFVDSKNRTISSDRNNIAPRLGLAYRLGDKTVLRAGAGVYYGFTAVSNSQRLGASYRKTAPVHWSLDGGVTPYATLQNPFPRGLLPGPGSKYGPLANWGFFVEEGLSDDFHNAEIYQWNAGVQQELPGQMLIEVGYTASRSVHLPWGNYTLGRNHNFVSRADREKWGSDGLAQLVPNPFLPLFTGANAKFDEPDSIYSNPTIPRINLLRPYPQFDGEFSGLKFMDANATYNAMVLRFEKRYSQGLNLLAGYTLARLTDDISSGLNDWLGIETGTQDPTNRRAEHGRGASDMRQRFVIGGSYELPFGRGNILATRSTGRSMAWSAAGR